MKTVITIFKNVREPLRKF